MKAFDDMMRRYGLAMLLLVGASGCTANVETAGESAANPKGDGLTLGGGDSEGTGPATSTTPAKTNTVTAATADTAQTTDTGTATAGERNAVGTLPCSDDGASDPAIYGPNSCPFGKHMDQWAGDWWTWAAMIPKGINPVYGGSCDQNQSGDVWFLAGSDGTLEQRSCTIPAGKAILVPLINGECHPWPEAEGCGTFKTERGLVACAKGTFKGETPDLLLEVDNRVVTGLEGHMITSQLFSLPGLDNPTDLPFPGLGPIPANNCGIPVGDNYGVTYGSYVMLKPLAPGEHVLHLRGVLSFYQPEVTYTITVR